MSWYVASVCSVRESIAVPRSMTTYSCRVSIQGMRLVKTPTAAVQRKTRSAHLLVVVLQVVIHLLKVVDAAPSTPEERAPLPELAEHLGVVRGL